MTHKFGTKRTKTARDVTPAQRRENLEILRAELASEERINRRAAAKATAAGRTQARKDAAFEAIKGMAYAMDAAHYQRAALEKAQAAFRQAIADIAAQVCVAIMKSVPAPVLREADLRAAIKKILAEGQKP